MNSCDGDHWAHKAKSVHNLALHRQKLLTLVYRKREERMSSEAGRPVRSLPGASRVRMERRGRYGRC